VDVLQELGVPVRALARDTAAAVSSHTICPERVLPCSLYVLSAANCARSPAVWRSLCSSVLRTYVTGETHRCAEADVVLCLSQESKLKSSAGVEVIKGDVYQYNTLPKALEGW
jgi:hypothetical protein